MKYFTYFSGHTGMIAGIIGLLMQPTVHAAATGTALPLEREKTRIAFLKKLQTDTALVKRLRAAATLVEAAETIATEFSGDRPTKNVIDAAFVRMQGTATPGRFWGSTPDDVRKLWDQIKEKATIETKTEPNIDFENLRKLNIDVMKKYVTKDLADAMIRAITMVDKDYSTQRALAAPITFTETDTLFNKMIQEELDKTRVDDIKELLRTISAEITTFIQNRNAIISNKTAPDASAKAKQAITTALGLIEKIGKSVKTLYDFEKTEAIAKAIKDAFDSEPLPTKEAIEKTFNDVALSLATSTTKPTPEQLNNALGKISTAMYAFVNELQNIMKPDTDKKEAASGPIIELAYTLNELAK